MIFKNISLVSIIFILTTTCQICTTSSIQERSNNSAKYYGEVLFTGASITEYYRSEGRDTWGQYYEPLEAANVGFAGDGAQRLIDRINGGLYNDLNARLVVLSDVGSNDIAGGWGEQQIVDNYGTLLNLIKSHFPNCKIILVALMPRSDRGFELDQRLRNLNGMLNGFADGDSVRWFNMENQLSPEVGQVYADLYWDDKLHLNAQGYKVWAETMDGLFNEIYYGFK